MLKSTTYIASLFLKTNQRWNLFDFPLTATYWAAGPAVSLLFIYIFICISKNAHEHAAIIWPLVCLQRVSEAKQPQATLWFQLLWPFQQHSEVGTEEQSEPFGNICGQLHGEEGAKERNLLLINKIMGAIRPFSHHYCLQSLFSPSSFPFSLYASPNHFFLCKNSIPCLRMSWRKRECEKKKASLEGER